MSVDRLGLEHRIEPREAKASWVENCAQKAIFIKQMRDQERRPILWIDADAVVLRPFHELVGCNADMAAAKRSGWHVSGGQIFFGAGPGADLIVNIWCRYCDEFPHIFDQVSLGYAWWDATLTTSPPAVLWLKDTILDIEDRSLLRRLRRKFFSRAAVFHAQESRRSKDKQEAPANEPFRSRQIPEWWRDAARKNRPFQVSDGQRLELGMA